MTRLKLRLLAQVIILVLGFHTQVRQTVLLRMCSSSQKLTSLLPQNTTMSQYIATSRMSEDKVWATEVEIISTAHLLQTDIYTYSKYGHELKWLKHTALFVDNTLQLNEKAVYLDHQTGVHFDVVLDVGTSVSSVSTAEETFQWSEMLKQESRLFTISTISRPKDNVLSTKTKKTSVGMKDFL